MSKLFLFLIMLIIFTGATSAAEISGSVASSGKKLADLPVALSRVNGTVQNDQSVIGIDYKFILLSETKTDKEGRFIFTGLEIGEYRVNVTYNNVVYGENIKLDGKSILDFNLSGRIEGSVQKANKTMVGVPVRLVDKNGIEVMNAFTNNSGIYEFNRVNIGNSYYVVATYADVPYTQPVNVSERSEFAVYDSTKEGDVITVRVDHILLSKAPTGIKVEEYIEFMNTGDKVFFSKDRAFLGVSTPEGITRFETDVMECCLQREKGAAWIDPMKPIMPGETYSATVAYIFNPEKSGFYKDMIYNTSYLGILTEKSNGFGIANRYVQKETVSNEGREFEVLTFTGIPGGQRIEVQVTGYVPTKTGSSDDFNYIIPVAAVLLIGAISYPLVRNRMGKKRRKVYVRPAAPASQAAPTASTPTASTQSLTDGPIAAEPVSEPAEGKSITEMSFDELLAEKRAAFESIMNIENEFNTGKISKDEYKDRKKEYREKAVLAIKQFKEAALNLDLAQPASVLEKIIAHVDDIDILEQLLEREEEGENRDELRHIIEQRIDDIEQNE